MTHLMELILDGLFSIVGKINEIWTTRINKFPISCELTLTETFIYVCNLNTRHFKMALIQGHVMQRIFMAEDHHIRNIFTYCAIFSDSPEYFCSEEPVAKIRHGNLWKL